MMDPLKLTGKITEGDKRYSVSLRDWDAMKRALWRSKFAWDIAVREATSIVARCKHADGCPAAADETEQCLTNCPDREMRLSALVVLGAARQFAPVDARRPVEQPYNSPSREMFSEVLAELAACQAELDALRGAVVTPPPPNDEATPLALASKQPPQPKEAP